MTFTTKPLRVTLLLRAYLCEYINPSSLDIKLIINLFEKSFLAKISNPKTTDATADPETRHGGKEIWSLYDRLIFAWSPVPVLWSAIQMRYILGYVPGFSAHASVYYAIIWHIFCETCMKMEIIGLRGGACPSRLLDPPLHAWPLIWTLQKYQRVVLETIQH